MQDEFGEIDPEEAPTSSPSRPRWVIAAVAAAAVVVVAAVGLAVTRPWSDSDSTADTTAPDDTVATTTAGVPSLTSQLILDEVPEGIALQFASDPFDVDGGFGFPEELSSILFVTPGATMNAGQWFGLTVSVADAGSFFEGPEMVTVQGQRAMIEEFDGVTTLTFQPDEAHTISLRSHDVGRADTLALAESIEVDDGQPVFLDPQQVDGFDVLTESDGDVLALLYGGTSGASVQYGDNQGNTFLSVSNEVAAGTDWFTIARFIFGATATDATVHGLPAVAGTIDQFGFGVAAVIWLEGGRSVTVVGSPFDIDELTAISESVRPASDEEWQEALDTIGDFGGSGDVSNMLLVGAGDLPSRVTWSVEASFDDDLAEWCVATSDFSTACASLEPDLPILVLSDQTSGLGMTGILAVVDSDSPATTLRVTADSDEPILIPLRIIDESFPGPAAAFGIDGGDVVVELLDANGVVLQTVEGT